MNIYSPNFLGRKMSAATCEITQVTYETYVNFLGYRRITKRLPLHSYMGIERCRQVIQTKRDDVAGRLKSMGNGIFATQNSELNLKSDFIKFKDILKKVPIFRFATLLVVFSSILGDFQISSSSKISRT